MQKKNQGLVLWFTGIPSSGKTTLAKQTAQIFCSRELEVEVLDADDIRDELSPDLGFTPKDRDINTKRIAWIANLLSRHGIHVMISSVASSREHRERVRNLIKKFAIVYVRCPVSVCISRGGAYAKLRQRKLKGLAGGAKNQEELYKPYQEPINPEVVVDTDSLSIEESAQLVIARLESLKLL